MSTEHEWQKSPRTSVLRYPLFSEIRNIIPGYQGLWDILKQEEFTEMSLHISLQTLRPVSSSVQAEVAQLETCL